MSGSFTFSTIGTGSFENAADYTQAAPPPDPLVSGDSVTIATGTAIVDSPVDDEGFITIQSGATLDVTSTLTGGGTLVIGAGGTLDVGSGATMSLTGTVADAGVIYVASGGTFIDASSLTGAGAITVAAGGSATLGGIDTFATGTDYDAGTLVVGGTLTAPANAADSGIHEGTIGGTINLAGATDAVVDFSGSSPGEINYLATVNGFTAGDTIILGSSLTSGIIDSGQADLIQENNVPNGTGTFFALGDYDNLFNNAAADSVIRETITGLDGSALTILPSTEPAGGYAGNYLIVNSVAGEGYVLTEESFFTFSTVGTGSFAANADYLQGVAPPSTLVPGDFVTIASGTAVVATPVTDGGYVTIDSGATLDVTSTFAGGTVVDSGVIDVASGGTFIDTSSLTGAGAITIAAGGSATLGGIDTFATGTDYDAGTLVIGGTLAFDPETSGIKVGTVGGTIDMTGATDAVVDFVGSTPDGETILPSVTGFAAGDTIILGPGFTSSIDTTDVRNSGGYTVRYSGDDFNIGDYNGSADPALVIYETITGAGGSSFSGVLLNGATAAPDTGNYLVVNSVAGEGFVITVDDTEAFTFSGNGSFGNAGDYVQGAAPPSTLSGASQVTIGSGSATIATPVNDAGFVTIQNQATLDVTSSLTGAGSLAIGTGGTLVIGNGGTYGLTGSLTNNGTIVVQAGGTADIPAGTGGTIIDEGTVDLTGTQPGTTVNMAGTIGSTLNEGGTLANGTFTAAGDATNYGTGDTIGLTGTGLTGPFTGESYNNATGVLSFSDNGTLVNVSISPDVAGSYNANDFTLGVSNGTIELTTDIGGPSQFTFAGGTGSFTNPGDYAGGVAPGGSVPASSTVTVATGTAVIGNPETDNGTVTIQNGATVDLNSTLTGAGSLAIGAGGSLVIGSGGSLDLTGSLTNAGTIVVQNGASANIPAGTGGTIIDQGTVNLTGTEPPGGTTINMGGTIGSTLNESGALANGTFNAAGDATDYGKGDTINITGTGLSGPITGESYNNATGVLSFLDGGVPVNVSLSPAAAGTYNANDFTLGVVNGVIELTTDIPCFAAGTRILGTDGDILVEDICPGDELVTVREGGPVSRKVVWTGKRAIDITRHPRPEMVRPVRIIAGAFGDNLPERDLRLSPLHAIYVNGCLFEAISLVNGTTIYQEQATRYVTYHHIELEAHDVLLAEGLPAESFLDTGDKTMFESVSGVTVLHPDFATPEGAAFCVPVVRAGERLEAVRHVLNTRAARMRTSRRA